MVQDRGHGGLWFIGFTGVAVPVSATLGGGFETDAWRIGQALAESGIEVPEAGVIGHLCAALRREGIVIIAREPALEAPIAARRVWSFLHRPQIWASPHCAPGAEAGEVCDACGSREAAAIEEFIGVVARANDAARELACEVNTRSAWSPPIDRERVARNLARVEVAARTARGLSGALAHRTKVREMLGSIACILAAAREDAATLGVAL